MNCPKCGAELEQVFDVLYCTREASDCPPICVRCKKECILIESGINEFICSDENCKGNLADLFAHAGKLGLIIPRPETQSSVYRWCKDTFPEFKGLKGRATALVEEAVELCLAAGMTKEEIEAAVSVPLQKANLRKEDESDRGEIADVQICVWAYAEEAGFSAQHETDKKMEINRSRPPEYYEMKTKQKKELGMKLPE